MQPIDVRVGIATPFCEKTRPTGGGDSRNGYDYALFMDSDLTNNPADIPRFVREMQQSADVIKVSRFRGGGGMQGVPLRRALISRTGNWVAQMLFGIGIRDTICWWPFGRDLISTAISSPTVKTD